MRSTFTILLVLISFLIARGQIFVKQDATGVKDGTSWNDAYIDLQNALDSAVAGEQIWVASGTYIPKGTIAQERHFIVLTPVEIFGGFAGTELSLKEREPEKNKTILDGDVNGNDTPGNFTSNRGDNAHHILIIEAGNQQVRLDGFVFKGGMTKTDAYAPDSTDTIGIHRWSGGALFINNTPTIISHCVFQDNYGYEASAIMARNLDYTAAPVTIENSKFLMNGSINMGTCNIWPWSNSYIRYCTFSDNISGNRGSGLAILNSNAYVEDCTFDNNFSSNTGGGCYIWNNSLTGIDHVALNFKRCEFNNNNAGNGGGALQLTCFSNGFNLSIDSCLFNNNFTVADYVAGGAVKVVDYSDTESLEASNHVWIKNSIFSNNSSSYGGAMEFEGTDDSLHITIDNSQFIRNFTTGSDASGGAIYIWQAFGGRILSEIIQSTFTNNSSLRGGAIIIDAYNNSTPHLYKINGCQFADNEAAYGGAINVFTNNGPRPQGEISASTFNNNVGVVGGAISCYLNELKIKDCLFEDNITLGKDPELTGAGALHAWGQGNLLVSKTVFESNSSESESGAITTNTEVVSTVENCLFTENSGAGTIINYGQMRLLSNSFTGNTNGIWVRDNSETEIQNTIFNNDSDNLLQEGFPTIYSSGGNVSNDGTMTEYLTGYNSFEDFNSTDPLLGPDLVPMTGSPCIDAGNPEGLISTVDLAGNPRQYGNGVDIGAYESFLVNSNEVHWDEPGFVIFPNPVKNILYLVFENNWNGEVELIIFSLLGHVVETTSFQKASTKQLYEQWILNIPSGEYIVVLKTREKMYANKMIIQH